MTVSPKHAALAAKMVKINTDITKHIDVYYTILEEVKNTILPAIEGKIRDYSYEESDRKAETMERDIKDTLRAISKNNFEIQKYARELIERGESLERAAEQVRMYNIGETEQRMYKAKIERSGEKW